jgi:glycosyltransferase involved in cell wall biosynthesis
MKRILLFSHEFPPYLGGVGTVGAQLAAYLCRYGHEVHVMTRRQEGRQHIDNVVFHDVDVLPKLWFRSYRRALRELDLDGFDTIILNEAAPTIVAGKYFDQAMLGRCIVLIHGLEVEHLYRHSLANLPRKILGFARAHRRACVGARHVIAASRDMRDKFIAVIGPGHSAAVRVMYLGVDPDTFFLEPSDYRARRGLTDAAFVVVSGSRIIEEKGYPEMLRAFAELKSRVNGACWVVCGDGPYLARMRDWVGANGLSENVVFEGDCSRDRLRWIYNGCDAYWLCSRYREAFPLSYIEAQLAGLPTLGRNAGGVPEAIIPGKTGWLVERADEATDILAAYAAGERFDRAAIAEAGSVFSMEKTFVDFLEVV